MQLVATERNIVIAIITLHWFMHKLFKFGQKIIQTLSQRNTSESSLTIMLQPFTNKCHAIKSLMYFLDPEMVNKNCFNTNLFLAIIHY